MATSFYAGNTEKPLAYDFAERFDQEMWKYQFNLGVFLENQLYVRLGTLQDNEGISNALLLRLVGTYAALVLIIICFTILSVQQLTDTIEQKKRFQIISKLGVNKSDCGRYIRQQMIFKFGLPVMVSLIFSIGTLAFLTLTGYEEYIVYISPNEMLAIFAVVYAAFIGILISYFVSTYYLFKKHMALS
jgi:putative ABC transport system permease protein